MARPVSFTASFRIEWKVKNILSAVDQESEEFPFNGSLWKLVLGKCYSGSKLRIVLQETKRGKTFNDFKSRVFILDKNHTPQFVKEHLCLYTQNFYQSSIWSMGKTELWLKEGTLSTDDIVSFVCILLPDTAKEDRENKPLETNMNAKAGGSEQVHLLVFRRLFDENAPSDVILECVDRKIPAHWRILSARSEVFAAMFRNDMVESRTGVIKIDDMDPPMLEQFIQFIYTCKLSDMSMEAATQLYQAADKYCVESLKKDCSAFMKENLTEKSACCILLLADVYGDSDLKDCAVAFIVKAKLFLKDGVWMKFCEDHPILAMEVLNRGCKTLSFFV